VIDKAVAEGSHRGKAAISCHRRGCKCFTA
jgi:hypothetical protein